MAVSCGSMPDPRLKRSPPLVRFLKWLGLYAGLGVAFFLHYKRYPPEDLRLEFKPNVHESDRFDIIGSREELVKSAEQYRAEVEQDDPKS